MSARPAGPGRPGSREPQPGRPVLDRRRRRRRAARGRATPCIPAQSRLRPHAADPCKTSQPALPASPSPACVTPAGMGLARARGRKTGAGPEPPPDRPPLECRGHGGGGGGVTACRDRGFEGGHLIYCLACVTACRRGRSMRRPAL